MAQLAGGLTVPQLIVLLPDQAQGVLRGDNRLHRQGVWHGGQGQYRRDVVQAALQRPLLCEGESCLVGKPDSPCEITSTHDTTTQGGDY